MMVDYDLTVIWAAILGAAILIYVVLDGFDLGIGILYPLFPEKTDRDQMMNAVAPVWDGNETWLVLGGGGLFAAFPLAYAILLPALYPLVIAMLLALVFRGVAFEFRWSARRYRGLWDLAFMGGSTIAALTQGMILGAVLQGITVEGRAYAGGWWDWLTPFTVLTGIAVVIGYALLGATFLVMKTTGPVAIRCRLLAWPLTLGMVGAMALVSVWTPFLETAYWERWFGWPTVAFSGVVPVLVALCTFGIFRALTKGRDVMPFLLALALFLLAFGGLGISIWPWVIPGQVTIWDAASPEKSQWFMLIGAVILIPIILAYTAYSYWVFRGKLSPEDGYH